MRNDELEKALEETWRNKDKFYEDTKGLSMAEIIKRIEDKYKVRDAIHNINVSSPYDSSFTTGTIYESNET